VVRGTGLLAYGVPTGGIAIEADRCVKLFDRSMQILSREHPQDLLAHGMAVLDAVMKSQNAPPRDRLALRVQEGIA
jgi:hypothetical protein